MSKTPEHKLPGAILGFCLGLLLLGGLAEFLLEGLTDRRYWGPKPLFSFDKEVTGSPQACVDLDSDGTPELVTAREVAIAGELGWSLGRITHLGSNPAALELIAPEQVDDWHLRIAVVGDVDGDGCLDLGTSVSTHAKPSGVRGMAYVFSGRTGGLLRRLPSDERYDYTGLAIAAAGDVDGDGKGDLLLGGYKAPSGSGRIRLQSGATLQTLASFDGGSPGDQFGACFAALADLNGDGLVEIAVGAPGTGSGSGSVSVMSLETGERLWEALDPGADGFGSKLALHPDRDSDGVPELASGSALLSGRTGTFLEALDASQEYLGTVGDWDLDGAPDVLERRWVMETRFYDHHLYSRARVRSGRGKDALLDIAFTHPFPRSFVSDDLDGDGLHDVIVDEGRLVLAYGSAQSH